MAERIEPLTERDNKSGSEILEIGSEGEIPVKVSRVASSPTTFSLRADNVRNSA